MELLEACPLLVWLLLTMLFTSLSTFAYDRISARRYRLRGLRMTKHERDVYVARKVADTIHSALSKRVYSKELEPEEVLYWWQKIAVCCDLTDLVPEPDQARKKHLAFAKAKGMEVKQPNKIVFKTRVLR